VSDAAPAIDHVATCNAIPKCCRDHVYIFLVNGLDPINFGRLTGLRDYLHKLGFGQTYYGQLYHFSFFRKEIRRIHMEDPEAHFVLVGFSAGMNVVHALAAGATREGIWIDSLVYLSGNNPVTPMPADRPANVGHVLNVLASGMMGRVGERDYAENIRLEDAWHFDSPMHVRTQQLMAQEVAQLASVVPAPSSKETMPRGAFDDPTPRPIKQKPLAERDAWDFLKPVSRLKTPPEQVPADGHVNRQIDYRPEQ